MISFSKKVLCFSSLSQTVMTHFHNIFKHVIDVIVKSMKLQKLKTLLLMHEKKYECDNIIILQ